MSRTKCKFCFEHVNLNDEGVTYADGTCAHEQCHDNNEFERENAADLADHNQGKYDHACGYHD